MKNPSIHSRSYAPLEIESNLSLIVNDNSVQMRVEGNHVVLSGNVLRVLLSVRKNSGIISGVSKMINSAELILDHVDINICLYNERFAVLGPETKPVVKWAKTIIIRFFNRK